MFFSLLQSLETNKFGKTLESIRDWISSNEIVNSATINSLVYRIQIFNNEKESGVRHIIISQGDSSKSFLTVLADSFRPENVSPYIYSDTIVNNSVEAIKVFEKPFAMQEYSERFSLKYLIFWFKPIQTYNYICYYNPHKKLEPV